MGHSLPGEGEPRTARRPLPTAISRASGLSWSATLRPDRCPTTSHDPGHPSCAAACPLPRSMTSARSDIADVAAHGHRTPTPDTGRRTLDTWMLRRPYRTLDTGRVDRHAWTLDGRSGHWTPDAGRGRGQDDDGTAGVRTSWAITPSDTLGRPTLFPRDGTCGARQPSRFGGEATCPCETPSRTPGSCSAARRPGGALAHCSPRTISGRQ
jgi:hypothetical protein